MIVDAGAVLDGYCSDCTRTFAAGRLERELREAYDVCLRAQLAGLEAVRPGVTRCRRRRGRAGRHRGGGLRRASSATASGTASAWTSTRLPRVSTESTETLAAGNVTSVEPGVYLPGRGGIRIEDLVVVRDGGPEILTSFTKELVTLA